MVSRESWTSLPSEVLSSFGRSLGLSLEESASADGRDLWQPTEPILVSTLCTRDKSYQLQKYTCFLCFSLYKNADTVVAVCVNILNFLCLLFMGGKISARLLPEKLTVYTTLVGLLNARNYSFGGEFVEAMIRQLKECLKVNMYNEAVYLVSCFFSVCGCLNSCVGLSCWPHYILWGVLWKTAHVSSCGVYFGKLNLMHSHSNVLES